MRIAFTSDIHFRIPWREPILALAEQIRASRPDLLVIAGDLGEPLDMFTLGLDAFRNVAPHRAIVAGNHDVWHRAFSYTSERLWHSMLKTAASAYGYTWLEDENLLFDGVAVCGTIAWYDYSGRSQEIALNDDDYEKVKSLLSNDARYIDWGWSDREFALMVSSAFESRLDHLQADEHVRHIVVATHVPLFRECLRPATQPEEQLLNAYYANLPLGQKIASRDKVRVAISGHVHRATTMTLNRNGNGALSVYTNPADYGAPAALLLDTSAWKVTEMRVRGSAC